jgi:hypothetical protein
MGHRGGVKMKNKNTGLQKDQKGQALLFVVVALTVALSVGVSTSLRTLSSVSRTSDTDTSARVLAAAEGGLEHFLTFSTSDLDDFTATCDTLVAADANSDCVVEFPKSSNDNISSRAVVKVEDYVINDGDIYYGSVEGGQSFSIDLGSFNATLNLCWNENEAQSDVYYIISNGTNVSNWQKTILCPGSCHSTNNKGTTPAASCNISGLSGYTAGKSINVSAGSDKVLTIVPLQDRIEFALQPQGEDLNRVGYTITSQGELNFDEPELETITKRVTARRSLPYLPQGFYFSIFSDQGITTNED